MSISYNSLEELETKEKQWTILDNAMRQSLSRMSLLINGVDRKLDKQLDYLRMSVRKGADGKKIRAGLVRLGYDVSVGAESPAATGEDAIYRAAGSVEMFPRTEMLDLVVHDGRAASIECECRGDRVRGCGLECRRNLAEIGRASCRERV